MNTNRRGLAEDQNRIWFAAIAGGTPGFAVGIITGAPILCVPGILVGLAAEQLLNN